MTTKFKVLAGLLVLVFGLLVYMEANEAEPVNWFPSYAKKDKIPYGSYVLYNTLKKSVGNERFKEVNRPPFELLADSSTTFNGTYFFLNNYVNFDDAESHRLLRWVADGNTLFVAGNGIGDLILDTLGLDVETYYDLDNLDRKPLMQLANPRLKRNPAFYLDKEITASYFDEIDTLNTVVLGTFDLSKEDTLHLEEPKVHFIKQAFGDGEIVLHLMPESLTNYAMLRANNYRYAEGVLQYLSTSGSVLWDNHYKTGKPVQTSPLYMLLKNRYLKWAYYMLVIGVLMWVFFEGKRKQRAIPIIEPLPNKTLDFTKTIAGMYLDKMDHRSIAYHQINHFFELLRSEYFVNTGKRDAAFIEKVQLKSGNSEESTQGLFRYIEDILNKPTITKEELLRLNKLIEAFKNT